MQSSREANLKQEVWLMFCFGNFNCGTGCNTGCGSLWQLICQCFGRCG